MTAGNGHTQILSFNQAPARVVSLVPSMTESLFDLGVGEALVGVTDYCRPPQEAQRRLVRVGGTKSPRVEDVIGLQPDLVMANQEENTRPVVEALEAAGLKVWVTFPRSVGEAIQVLWALVRLFRLPEAAPRVETLEKTAAWSASAGAVDPVRTFVPIWQAEDASAGSWWMTISRDTYVHDVLAVCGAANVFGDRRRRHPLSADLGFDPVEDPGDRDVRYPRVGLDEVRSAGPELILLPSEPFPFGEGHVEAIGGLLQETPAARNGRIQMVDGRLLTWHGTRLGRALVELPQIIQAVLE